MSIASVVYSIANADRRVKRAIQITIDAIAAITALSLSMIFRLENLDFLYQKDFWLLCLCASSSTILVFWKIGLYRAFLRYISISAAVSLMVGSLFVCAILLTTVQLLYINVPVAVLINFAIVLFLFACGIRFLLRDYTQKIILGARKSVAVYGAGVAGTAIVQALKTNSQYQVRVIIDDEVVLQGGEISGIEISACDKAIGKMKRLRIGTVLLAIPSAPLKKSRR